MIANVIMPLSNWFQPYVWLAILISRIVYIKKALSAFRGQACSWLYSFSVTLIPFLCWFICEHINFSGTASCINSIIPMHTWSCSSSAWRMRLLILEASKKASANAALISWLPFLQRWFLSKYAITWKQYWFGISLSILQDCVRSGLPDPITAQDHRGSRFSVNYILFFVVSSL